MVIIESIAPTFLSSEKHIITFLMKVVHRTTLLSGLEVALPSLRPLV